MQKKLFTALFLVHAKNYIDGIPDADSGAIKRDIEEILTGDHSTVSTKKLRGNIRELIVGHHRIVYFKIDNNIYFVRGFRKKSAKTSKNEIDYAEKVYKQLK
jgi:phage-related protein